MAPKKNVEKNTNNANVIIDPRPDVTPEAWALPGTSEFSEFVRKEFAAEDSGSGRRDIYMKQQRFVRDYLQYSSPYRGLLLYHGLGSGKTCSAIAATEAMRSEKSDVKVYVMTPASLRRNYVRELRMCGSAAYREAQKWSLVKPTENKNSNSKDKVKNEEDTLLGRVRPAEKLVKAHGGLWTPSHDDGTIYSDLNDEQREQVREQVDSVIELTHIFVGYNGLSTAAIRKLVGAEDTEVDRKENQVNKFDDSVVVIDEVHNFISNVSNGRLLKTLYDAIMAAQRCKVILLSGTPLVNKPEELALAVNLAHGPIIVHDFVLKRAMNDEQRKQMEACAVVQEFKEGTTGLLTKKNAKLLPMVSLRLLPEGFRRSSNFENGSRVVRDIGTTIDAAENEVRAVLESCGILEVTRRKLLLLPNDREEFRESFVDRNNFEVKNTDVLMRRMQGTISFFRGHAEELYPRIGKMSLVKCEMSPRQFSEYSVQRAIEVSKERRAKRQRAAMKYSGSNDEFDVDDANYRPFSRAVCNFAFPEDVPRPYKASVTVAAEDDEGQGQQERNKERVYLKALDDAVNELAGQPGRLVLAAKPGTDEGLDALSPKMAAIVRSVKSLERGTAIVYSQLRRAEGIKLLTASLDANGFAEIVLYRQDQVYRAKLVKHSASTPEQSTKSSSRSRYMVYSNDDPQLASLMLLIFNNQLRELPPQLLADLRAIAASNSDSATKSNDTKSNATKSKTSEPGEDIDNLRGALVRALLFTKSGSEGISTRNVRQVHILEPFWHANRVEQVIGRARRAHSHDELPSGERNVDVYIYMATFSQEQLKNLKLQKDPDGGKTSDEFVHEVAQKKRKVLRGLLDAMKRSAVDCVLHSSDAKKSCFVPEDRGKGKKLYDALKLDEPLVSTTKYKLSRQNKNQNDEDDDRYVQVRVDGIMYYADKKTGELYDFELYRDGGRAVPVGKRISQSDLQKIQ